MVTISGSCQNYSVLAPCLCRQRSRRITASDVLCCVRTACQNNMFDSRSRSEYLQCITISNNHLQSLFRNSCIPKSLGKQPRHRSSNSCRLQNNSIPSGKSRYNSANRNGTRKIPRRDNQYSTFRCNIHIRQISEQLHTSGIETGIINSFRNFHIPLHYRLPGNSTHTTYQVTSHFTQPISRFIHYLMTLLKRSLSPSCRVTPGYLNDSTYLFHICLRHFTNAYLIILTTIHIAMTFITNHHLFAYLQRNNPRRIQYGFFPSGKDTAHPFLIFDEIKVGIRLVSHLISGWNRSITVHTILCPCRNMGNTILHPIGFFKLVLQETPSIGTGLQVKRVSKEIVGSRIFVHTPHQIGNSIEKMLVFYHRSIKNHMIAKLRLCTPHMVCHTLQHLKSHIFGTTQFLTQ